jgi:CubicO group peptidase (beta-lactamase class C family)
MRKIILFQIIAVIIISVCSCTQSSVLQDATPASVKVSKERLNRIDNMLQQSIDSGWITGAVGFVARDSKIIYNRSFGINDIETKSPMHGDAIFRIASQTKAITSIAVMMLFEEGKFLLDDPVSKYIPEFANPRVLDQFNEKDTTYTTVPANREITVRDLLTHTSGIDYAIIGSEKMRAIYAKEGIPVGFENKKLVLGDAIKKLAKMPLAHQPGNSFTYGLNTDVTGYLVEVLSGMSLDQFFKQRILEPLAMTDTYFYLPSSKFDRLVTLYTEDNKHHPAKWTDETLPGVNLNYPLVEGTYYSGGAGLSSTIKDYATFLQMLLNNGEYNGQRLLSRHTVELITSNQIGNLNLDRDKFGLGFQITSLNGQSKLGVSEGSFSWGGMFGTTYWVDPREHLVCLLFIQQWPLSHSEIREKFRVLVYQALND